MRWVSWLSLAAAIPAAAQQPAAPPQPAVWELDWHTPYCMITTGDPKTLSLSIWSVPGSNTAEVYFIGPRAPRFPHNSDARINLQPSGATQDGRAFWPKPMWSGMVGVTVYDAADFLDKLGQANQLSASGTNQTVTMTLQGAAKPMQALSGCLADKLREWGVDPATLVPPKDRPRGDLTPWLTAEDYPTDALDSNTSGTVVVRLTTDPKGRVLNCAAVENTGTKSMAEVTCRAALSRGRYAPVIGPDGQPRSATFIAYTTFRVFQ